jgi:thiosulfate dehydrogenase
MKQFVVGLVASVVIVALVLICYFGSGIAPVTPEEDKMPFEAKLIALARRGRYAREDPQTVPLPINDDTMIAGARLYAKDCARCHGGLPGQPKIAFTNGMYPPPQEQLKKSTIPTDGYGKTYWRIANGMRLSGMPEFRTQLSETEMWQLTVMLVNSRNLPPAVKESLKIALAQQTGTTSLQNSAESSEVVR